MVVENICKCLLFCIIIVFINTIFIIIAWTSLSPSFALHNEKLTLDSIKMCVNEIRLTVLLDAVSWVQSSPEEKFSGRGDFSVGVNIGSDSIPSQNSFR